MTKNEQFNKAGNDLGITNIDNYSFLHKKARDVIGEEL